MDQIKGLSAETVILFAGGTEKVQDACKGYRPGSAEWQSSILGHIQTVGHSELTKWYDHALQNSFGMFSMIYGARPETGAENYESQLANHTLQMLMPHLLGFLTQDEIMAWLGENSPPIGVLANDSAERSHFCAKLARAAMNNLMKSRPSSMKLLSSFGIVADDSGWPNPVGTPQPVIENATVEAAVEKPRRGRKPKPKDGEGNPVVAAATPEAAPKPRAKRTSEDKARQKATVILDDKWLAPLLTNGFTLDDLVKVTGKTKGVVKNAAIPGSKGLALTAEIALQLVTFIETRVNYLHESHGSLSYMVMVANAQAA